MRGAPRARQDILRPRRAVKVGARPLIAIVMPHELQEQQCIGSGKVIARGSFDSRRSITAAIARGNLSPEHLAVSRCAATSPWADRRSFGAPPLPSAKMEPTLSGKETKALRGESSEHAA